MMCVCVSVCVFIDEGMKMERSSFVLKVSLLEACGIRESDSRRVANISHTTPRGPKTFSLVSVSFCLCMHVCVCMYVSCC